jgi:hypothetical protein
MALMNELQTIELKEEAHPGARLHSNANLFKARQSSNQTVSLIAPVPRAVNCSIEGATTTHSIRLIIL